MSRVRDRTSVPRRRPHSNCVKATSRESKIVRTTIVIMHRGKIPLDLGSGLLPESVENDIYEAGEPLWDVLQALEFMR